VSELIKDRTTFIIAHRLSTVRLAEEIVVLEHGEIVEHGRHEELLALGARYSDMVQSQESNVSTSELSFQS
jgi:ABC-type multidrug transport system fused ATPase/permease subunit